jgi:ABC-type Fe3+-hydroxamate transport system substrate-binding protein
MRSSKALLLPVLVATAAIALAGCSSSTSTSSSTPSKTASSFSCTDGHLTVTGSAHAKINVTTPCATITVKSDGAIVSLPNTTALEITGSKNTISVDSAATITATGADNNVFYGAAKAPTIKNTGTGNTIAAR